MLMIIMVNQRMKLVPQLMAFLLPMYPPNTLPIPYMMATGQFTCPFKAKVMRAKGV